MGRFGIAVLVLLLAGAAASWTVGAIAFARAQERRGAGRAVWLAAVAWPFGMANLRDAAPEQASVVNKAMVAFIVCMTLAAATVSLSTNLNRLSR